MERVEGFEPSPSAWQADMLPLTPYPRNLKEEEWRDSLILPTGEQIGIIPMNTPEPRSVCQRCVLLTFLYERPGTTPNESS